MTIDARYMQLGTGLQVGPGPNYPLEATGATGNLEKTHSTDSFSSFSTGSTSFVNVPGAVITKATQACKNLVLVNIPVDNGAESYALQLTVDGAAQTDSDFTDICGFDNGLAQYAFLTNALTAGSRIFQLQAKSVGGATVNFGAGTIQVIELDTNFDGYRARFSTFNTTSTSYVDVTGATVSQTTRTKKCLVTATFAVNNGTSNFAIQAVLNGSSVAGTELTEISAQKNGLITVSWIADLVPYQANTFKLQIKRTSGSDTIVLSAGNFNVIELSDSLGNDMNPSGSFSTTSASYVDVESPSNTIDIQTQDATGAIPFTSTATSPHTAVATLTATTSGNILFLISAAYLQEVNGQLAWYFDSSPLARTVPFNVYDPAGWRRAFSQGVIIPSVSAASHTFSLRAAVSSGTVNFYDPRLSIIQLPASDDSGALVFGDDDTGSGGTSSVGTYSDFPAINITMTTGARRVLLMAMIEKSAGSGLVENFTFVIDGVNQETAGTLMGKDNEPDLSFVPLAYITDVLSAASHTFKVAINSTVGAALHGCHMTAVELPQLTGGVTHAFGRDTHFANQSIPTGTLGTRTTLTGSSSALTTQGDSSKALYVCNFTSVTNTTSANWSIFVRLDGVDYKEYNHAFHAGAALQTITPTQTICIALIIDAPAGAHTIDIQVEQNGVTGATISNVSSSAYEFFASVGGDATVTLDTINDKALVSYTAPVSNATSNFALQLMQNGSPIADSEVTNNSANKNGFVSISGLATGLTPGVNDFSVQVKRTSGSDTIQLGTGVILATELPDEQIVGSGFVHAGDTVRLEQERDGLLLGVGERLSAAQFQSNETERGFMGIPRMTATQRTDFTTEHALGVAHEGLFVFNLTTGKLNFWNGSAWEVVTSA